MKNRIEDELPSKEELICTASYLAFVIMVVCVVVWVVFK